ncbi:MAG TPA: autotransporter outer membrane beta-barrel domain-containing protein [Bacteroidota bacterium]|nr:autotransporter outer membrane beta-barrel domain-containing protein [Bacteroidota bacterium]
MVKRIATIIVAVALGSGTMLAGAHPGGLARELALGGSGLTPTPGFGPALVINPFIYDDPTLMLLNPAYQKMYKDYAWMNIGGGTLNGTSTADNGYGKQFSGVNFALSKDLTVGTVLSFDPSFANYLRTQLGTFVGAVRGVASPVAPLPPIDVFEVVGTLDVGNIVFGAGILYGWAKNDATNLGIVAPPAANNSQLSANVFGLRLGMLMDLGGGSSFDASAALRFDNATDNMTATSAAGAPANPGNYSASATEINVNARLKLKMSNKVNFVPYAAFGNVSGQPKQDAAATGATAYNGSVKLSAMLFSVGAGMEYKLSNFYLAGGLSFRTSDLKSEISPAFVVGTPNPGTTTTTLSATEFPVFNLGIEWTLLDWLTGRMGYYRTFQSLGNKTERPNNGLTTTTDYWNGNSNVFIGGLTGTDNNLLTFGLGLHFGNFALDGTVSAQALRRGLGLIGAQDDINTFGYLTASYCFE